MQDFVIHWGGIWQSVVHGLFVLFCFFTFFGAFIHLRGNRLVNNQPAVELEGTVGISVITEAGLAVSEALIGERVASGAGQGGGGMREWGGLSGREQRNQSQGTGPWREHHVVKRLIGFEVEKDRSSQMGQ